MSVDYGLLRRDPWPGGLFSLVAVSNVLHFLTWEDCELAATQLFEKLEDHGLLYVVVPSNAHPSASGDRNYFKTFFSRDDLAKLFPNTLYEWLYYAEHEKRLSNWEKELLVKANKAVGVEAKQANQSTGMQDSGITMVLRKR